jgi:hypothetical protein
MVLGGEVFERWLYHLITNEINALIKETSESYLLPTTM